MSLFLQPDEYIMALLNGQGYSSFTELEKPEDVFIFLEMLSLL